MANNESTVLDTPERISLWVFLSRMHQLQLEINTGLKASTKMPILRAMHREGLIDIELRGTKANKVGVLQLMVEKMKEIDPNYRISPSMQRALDA